MRIYVNNRFIANELCLSFCFNKLTLIYYKYKRKKNDIKKKDKKRIVNFNSFFYFL